MDISILVIYEKGKDGRGPRDQILRAQICGSGGYSTPLNWNVLFCPDFSKMGLKSFCDGRFDYVVVLQAECLTEPLLDLVLQKLRNKASRVIAVYKDATMALTAPWFVYYNHKCVPAYAHRQPLAEYPTFVYLGGIREYLLKANN